MDNRPLADQCAVRHMAVDQAIQASIHYTQQIQLIAAAVAAAVFTAS